MIVAVIGCGNMQTAPELCATLAQFAATKRVEIRLYDPNEERLELVLRLLAELVGAAIADSVISATSHVNEALNEVTHIIFTLHEDCLKRMVLMPTSVYDPLESLSLSDLPRGDFNRPTPVDRLSPATRELIAGRQGQFDLHLAAGEAVGLALTYVKPAACVSLGHSVPAPGIHALDWPNGISENDAWKVPHQILRWVKGDDQPVDLMKEAGENALVDWLNGLD